MLNSTTRTARILTLYLNGHSVREIARSCGIGKSTVGVVVKQAGISRDKRVAAVVARGFAHAGQALARYVEGVRV